MNKKVSSKWYLGVFVIITVTLILLVGSKVPSVIAQFDLTSSSNGDTVAAPPSIEEGAPGSGVMAAGETAYSTADGLAPVVINTNLDESEVHLYAVDGPIPSSNDSGATDGFGTGSIKIEPSRTMAGSEGNEINANTNLRFVGSTFKPRTNDVSYDTSGSGGCVFVTGGDASTVWNVPLTLPNGAQIEWLRMYYYDANASTMGGWFSKYDLYGDLIDEWYIPSVNGGYGYNDVQILPVETINYNLYSYVLNMRPVGTGNTLQFCGMRMFYTVFGFNFMPFINKR